MRTSTAGSDVARAAGQRGFTLVELLVVLLILALGAATASPALGRFFIPKPVPTPSDQLMTALALARDRALLRQRPFRGFLDLAEKRFVTATGEVLLQLPANLRIEAAHAPQAPRLPCLFGADGHGCAMTLRVYDGDPPWLLAVDPVTGRVSMKREAIADLSEATS